MPDYTRQSVSATESPALFNASPYHTRWSLYRLFKFGEELPRVEDNRMDWGTRMEPLVLQAAAEKLRLEVIPNRVADGKQVYIRNGVLGCTRDATVICPDRGPGALETKIVFDYRVWMREWDAGKTPPRHHEIQLQQQMKVGEGETPFQWGVLAAWVGADMFLFERKPITDLWFALDAEARKFLDDVAAGREPDPFGSPIEFPLMNEVFKPDPVKILDLSEATGANIAWAEKARMCRYHMDEASGNERAAKALKAELMALMKDHAEATLPHGIKVKNKRIGRAGYTVKPSAYNQLDLYVPPNLPDDLPSYIKDGEIAL